jgi:hypothetical protein
VPNYDQDPKRKQGRPKVLKELPRVYNINRGDAPLSARYCGRGSPWGNPFVIGGWWPLKQRRMTRDDVCDRFRDEILPKLDVKELRGVDLECHCAPLRCHCNDIIRKANPGYEEKLAAHQARFKAKLEAKAEGKDKAKPKDGYSEADRERWKALSAARGEERRKYREGKA